MLVLASQSPRRHELLTAAGIPHLIRAATIDETPHPGEAPLHYVRRIAEAKAHAVPLHFCETILAADTTVISPCGEILGKPVDDADACRMLTLLSDSWHEVATAICFRTATATRLDHEVTRVHFTVLDPATIAAYVATGEPRDKAGAYAIQGRASLWIDRIEGSYTNVVGLPVSKLKFATQLKATAK